MRGHGVLEEDWEVTTRAVASASPKTTLLALGADFLR